MIRGRAIEKRYGRKRVLSGIDVAVPVGGFALVTGPNGSGKTTFLNALVGVAKPNPEATGGEVAAPAFARIARRALQE